VTDSKHTQGPWAVFWDTRGSDILGVGDASGGSIAHMWRDGEERISNANLIAAAPCLLEALEAVMRCFDIKDGLSVRDEQAIKHAASAIAKARGA